MEYTRATIRAAREEKASAIIQVFPWALHTAEHRLIAKFAILAASTEPNASLHMDHCHDYDDSVRAMNLGFDNIMVAISHLSPEDNVLKTNELTQRAHAVGIAVEAEMGRIDGVEDGVEAPDKTGLLTEPKDAVAFVKETNVDFLAPAFGNVHGAYPKAGPAAFVDLDRLQRIRTACPLHVHLVLHGHSDFSDDLTTRCLQIGGIRKINVNRTICNRFMHSTREVWAAVPEDGHISLTSLVENSIDAFSNDIREHMRLFMSSGKANW